MGRQIYIFFNRFASHESKLFTYRQILHPHKIAKFCSSFFESVSQLKTRKLSNTASSRELRSSNFRPLHASYSSDFSNRNRRERTNKNFRNSPLLQCIREIVKKRRRSRRKRNLFKANIWRNPCCVERKFEKEEYN